MRTFSFILDDHLEQAGANLADVIAGVFGWCAALRPRAADAGRAGLLFGSRFDVGSEADA
jgi:hypothetical protein